MHVVVVGHGRRRRVAADAPEFGVPVRLAWLARLWRWSGSSPNATIFCHPTVSALARHLGAEGNCARASYAG